MMTKTDGQTTLLLYNADLYWPLQQKPGRFLFPKSPILRNLSKHLGLGSRIFSSTYTYPGRLKRQTKGLDETRRGENQRHLWSGALCTPHRVGLADFKLDRWRYAQMNRCRDEELVSSGHLAQRPAVILPTSSDTGVKKSKCTRNHALEQW